MAEKKPNNYLRAQRIDSVVLLRRRRPLSNGRKLSFSTGHRVSRTSSTDSCLPFSKDPKCSFNINFQLSLAFLPTDQTSNKERADQECHNFRSLNSDQQEQQAAVHAALAAITAFMLTPKHRTSIDSLFLALRYRARA